MFKTTINDQKPVNLFPAYQQRQEASLFSSRDGANASIFQGTQRTVAESINLQARSRSTIGPSELR
jgi:hypothetical protein